VLSGRRIGAADAQGRGLMSAVCPLDELEGAGLAACRALAQKPAAAFSAKKHYSRRQLRREIVEACAAARRLQDEVASSIGSASWMF
jgi:enoyl-CoA hydratase/carnithine racemase